MNYWDLLKELSQTKSVDLYTAQDGKWYVQLIGSSYYETMGHSEPQDAIRAAYLHVFRVGGKNE